MRWRLIVDAPGDGATNMAVDHALLESVQAGGRPVLRLYRWEPACLSLGRNQPGAAEFDAGLAADRGIDVVRRPTGGLAVYHDHELTYAVVAPAGLLGRPRAAYMAINRALAAGLRRLGAPVALAAGPGPAAGHAVTPSPAPGLARHPCFQQLAEGEIVAAGRKLVGSAVRLERGALLQHGSILLDGDQSEAARLQRGVTGAPDSVGLHEILGRTPDWTELRNAVIVGFGASLGIDFDADRLGRSESDRARVLRQRYRSDEWTWRR